MRSPEFSGPLLGSAVGTMAVQQIDPAVLNVIIPFLLLAIAISMLVSPDLGNAVTRSRMPRGAFYSCFGLLLGFYDGFFGPGVGTFWAIAFVLGLGFDLRQVDRLHQGHELHEQHCLLCVFALGGFVLWLPGIVMAAGQIAGARLGSGMVREERAHASSGPVFHNDRHSDNSQTSYIPRLF